MNLTDNRQAAPSYRSITLVAACLRSGMRCCQRFQQPLTGAVLVAMVIIVMSAGCATNPVTGKSDFVLMSEDDEIALGRQYNVEVLKQERRLENPALSAYVQRVGEQLARSSHRPNLIYRFTVLDSADVNAFALPGGYIYITRGLLAYLNSEAELAAVLGHEIGHVTARHSVRQHSAATATGVIGAVIAAASGIQGANDLTNILGNAIVLGYGREQELEADRLGAEYLARTDYDPRAMIRVIEALKEQELFDKQLAEAEGREPNAYHGLFSTHPSNDQRLQEVVNSAGRLQGSTHPRVNRDEFLRQLEGLPFGDSAAEGIRRENRFYHKELDLALEFPVGWRIENLVDRLAAIAPENKAQIVVTLEDQNRRISPRAFITERLGYKELRNGEEIHDSGLVGYAAIADVNTDYGRRPVRVVVLYHHDKALIFRGVAKDARDPYRYDREFLAAARSYHTLTPEEQALARAKRLHVISATSTTRFRDLARQSPISSYPEQQLRLLNSMFPSGEPAAGQPVKIVR